MENKRLKATVYGRVQGVSFRYYTRKEAWRLGLVGWVANRQDGTVQVVAEGEEKLLLQLLDYLHRGSPAAAVNRVQAEWESSTDRFREFSVRYF